MGTGIIWEHIIRSNYPLRDNGTDVSHEDFGIYLKDYHSVDFCLIFTSLVKSCHTLLRNFIKHAQKMEKLQFFKVISNFIKNYDFIHFAYPAGKIKFSKKPCN